jgi:hypothetical protein
MAGKMWSTILKKGQLAEVCRVSYGKCHEGDKSVRHEAVVVEVGRTKTVVLTADHAYQHVRRRPDHIVGQKILVESSDFLLFGHKQMEVRSMTKQWMTVAASLILVAGLTLGGLALFQGKNALQTANDIKHKESSQLTPESAAALAAHPVAAVIAVDINPSVELSLDAEGLVIEAAAMNSDAETLDLVLVLGLPAEEAIATIVAMASEAGFITPDDGVDDFVVLTAVNLEDSLDTSAEESTAESAEVLTDDGSTETAIDQVLSRLRQRLIENPDLDAVTFAMLQASEEQRQIAHEQQIPLGLELVNELAIANGIEPVDSVREFFLNPDLFLLALENGLVVKRPGPGPGGQSDHSETMGLTQSSGQGPGQSDGLLAGGGDGSGSGPENAPRSGDPTGEPTGEPTGTGQGAGGANRGGKRSDS